MGLITNGEVKNMEWLKPFIPAICGAFGQVARILWAVTREKVDEEGEAYMPTKLHLAKTLFYGAIGGAVIGAAAGFSGDPVLGFFPALLAGWASADAIETGEKIFKDGYSRFKSE